MTIGRVTFLAVLMFTKDRGNLRAVLDWTIDRGTFLAVLMLTKDRGNVIAVLDCDYR